MRERKEELAHLLTLEVGKLIDSSRAEVDLASGILTYYGEHGPELLEERPLPVPEGTAVLVNEPLGVLLGVMPWNFPLYQVARFAGPNLVRMSEVRTEPRVRQHSTSGSAHDRPDKSWPSSVSACQIFTGHLKVLQGPGQGLCPGGGAWQHFADLARSGCCGTQRVSKEREV